MVKFSFYILVFLSAFGIILFSGCASSTNSMRYSEKTKVSENENTSVRYSSGDDENNIAASDHSINDTLGVTEDSLISDPDVIPESNEKIDISEILKKYESSNTSNELDADKSSPRERMLMEIIKYLNTPYKYGGNSKKGIDCSAFTKTIYEKALSVNLERSAREQYREGEVIRYRDDLKFGDLIFFNTRRWVKPGHVGIYIGDHLFAHASSSNGVTVSSLDEPYYSKRFMGGRRIEDNLGSNKISGIN